MGGHLLQWLLSRARIASDQAARMVFGNNGSWTGNIRGRQLLRRSQRASVLLERPTPKRADLFRQVEWQRFDNHIPTDVLANVARSFEVLIVNDHECSNLGQEVAEAHRYLRFPNQKIEDLHLLLTEEVADVIRAYYGSHFRVRSIRAYRNQSVPKSAEKSDVYGNLWHLDPELVCDLRYFVYLSPYVGPQHGPLHVMERSAVRWVVRSGYISRSHVVGPARRYLENARSWRPIEGPRGTAVLMNTQCVLHRAGIPAPGEHRDIVQFWITPSAESMPADWGTRVIDPVWQAADALPGDG